MGLAVAERFNCCGVSWVPGWVTGLAVSAVLSGFSARRRASAFLATSIILAMLGLLLVFLEAVRGGALYLLVVPGFVEGGLFG